MKAVLDTCVLYPTVMREMLLGVAEHGLFEPLWSDRILEEWRRATIKLGPVGALQAESDIAQVRAAFPRATVTVPAGVLSRLWLPDADDIHVLAAGVAGSADSIITLNAKDFPKNILAEEDMTRADPDWFLLEQYKRAPEVVTNVAKDVLHRAQKLSGQDWSMKSLMKKARLQRLGKALDSGSGQSF